MTLSSRNTSFRCSADGLLAVLTWGCALVSAAVVLLILVFLAREAWPALQHPGIRRFVLDESWHPLSQRFNLLPMIAGTGLTSLGAILIATPLGLGSAIFAVFYAPPVVARWYRRFVELLAGIPSVVYGLWGLVNVVPLLAVWGGSGQGLLTATLILALMILPMVALTSQAALTSVPQELIAGGAALGLGRWAIVWRLAVPAARRGVAAGILLGLTRALGETMAVVMVAGNVVQFPSSILSPVRTLTANMALEMGYATSEHRSILFVSGLMLMAVVTASVLFLHRLQGPPHE